MSENNKDFIDPGTPMNRIDDDVVLYAVNNTDSNIILNDGTNTVTLTAPGRPGSIQVISKDMMKNPGFMGLWSVDKIRISTSADVGQRAVSEIQIRAEKEKAHKEHVQQVIDESKAIADGGLGKQTDESFMAQDFKDTTPVVGSDDVDTEPEQMGQEQTEPEPEAEEKPARNRRTKKKTEDK